MVSCPSPHRGGRDSSEMSLVSFSRLKPPATLHQPVHTNQAPGLPSLSACPVLGGDGGSCAPVPWGRSSHSSSSIASHSQLKVTQLLGDPFTSMWRLLSFLLGPHSCLK